MPEPKKLTPRKPIYVTNPNDPRLKAYQDSLTSYNLAPAYNKQTLSNLQKANTVKEGVQDNLKTNEEFQKKGLNYQLGFNGKEFPRQEVSDGFVGAIKYDYKKPVQPVVLAKKVTKANVAPKELSMPKSSIKVQKTVKLPSVIRDIKYDTQKGTVLVNLDGTQKSMPRKEFDAWVNKPENRKMFNEYRTTKANKK